MARELVYSCDSCGKSGIAQKDIWKVTAVSGKQRRSGELCDECASRLRLGRKAK